jgi:hypothetical protein
VRRSQAHTELVVEEFELGVLWDEYGLVGDIVVSILSFYFQAVRWSVWLRSHGPRQHVPFHILSCQGRLSFGKPFDVSTLFCTGLHSQT